MNKKLIAFFAAVTIALQPAFISGMHRKKEVKITKKSEELFKVSAVIGGGLLLWILMNIGMIKSGSVEAARKDLLIFGGFLVPLFSGLIYSLCDCKKSKKKKCASQLVGKKKLVRKKKRSRSYPSFKKRSYS